MKDPRVASYLPRGIGDNRGRKSVVETHHLKAGVFSASPTQFTTVSDLVVEPVCRCCVYVYKGKYLTSYIILHVRAGLKGSQLTPIAYTIICD